MSDGPSFMEVLEVYLGKQDAIRAVRARDMLAALTPRERLLVREAATMGYVRGTLNGRPEPGEDFPRDNDIVAHVLISCHESRTLYPTIAALAEEPR